MEIVIVILFFSPPKILLIKLGVIFHFVVADIFSFWRLSDVFFLENNFYIFSKIYNLFFYGYTLNPRRNFFLFLMWKNHKVDLFDSSPHGKKNNSRPLPSRVELTLNV